METSFPKSLLLLWTGSRGRRLFRLRILCKIQAIRKFWGDRHLCAKCRPSQGPPSELLLKAPNNHSVDRAFLHFDQISLKGCYLVIFWGLMSHNNERSQVSGVRKRTWELKFENASASAFPVATRLERLDQSSSTGLVDKSCCGVSERTTIKWNHFLTFRRFPVRRRRTAASFNSGDFEFLLTLSGRRKA
jgi:hypothetical protein